MQITLSTQRGSRDMKRTRLVRKNRVYLPGWGRWKTTWSKHSRGSGKCVLSRLDFTVRTLSARMKQPSNSTSPNCAGITQLQSYPCVTQGWLPTSKASAPPSLPFRETSSTEQGLFHNLVLMQSATYEYLTLLGTSINHLVLGMSGQNFNLFYS